MMINAKYLATKEQERFVSPQDWDFSIYSFDPKSFWYSKTNLPLSEDFEIVRYDFRGQVRFNAGLKRRGLQLNFIDSYSTVEARLQGIGEIDSILMITIGGYDWDGLSDVGALGIELNFSEKLANQILVPEILFAMEKLGKFYGSGRSIVVRPSRAALRLKQRAMKFLGGFDSATGIRFDDVNSNLDIPAIEIPVMTQEDKTFNHEILVEMSRNVIHEITDNDVLNHMVSSKARRDLALRIEELLWAHPSERSYLKDLSLDELSIRLNASRRTLQLCIQEQFGVGFIAFRKIIRLYQIRAELIRENSYKSITSVANDYHVNHLGRFSKEYKEFFGNLPSKDNQLRKPNLQMPSSGP
jgi:AraC-like DNA-binding protein